MGSALGISLGLRLYFTVYPSSRHNTDTVSGRPEAATPEFSCSSLCFTFSGLHGVHCYCCASPDGAVSCALLLLCKSRWRSIVCTVTVVPVQMAQYRVHYYCCASPDGAAQMFHSVLTAGDWQSLGRGRHSLI